MKIGTFILDSLKEMMVGVVGFLPVLTKMFVALGILLIGWLIAKSVTKLLVTFCRAISLDKYSNKAGLDKILRKGGVKQKTSNLVGCVAYWVMMVMVLITSVKAFGLTVADDFLSKLFVIIPAVVIGALTLIIGMLIAKAVSSLIYIAAKNTDMPIPEALRDLSKYAIVIYVSIIYLKEIGFISLFAGNHSIFIAGVVFALALAFGLAGKDVAHKYLSVIDRK